MLVMTTLNEFHQHLFPELILQFLRVMQVGINFSVFPGICLRRLGGGGSGKTKEFDNFLAPSPPVGKTLLETTRKS